MLKQCLENIGERLLHACISSIIINHKVLLCMRSAHRSGPYCMIIQGPIKMLHFADEVRSHTLNMFTHVIPLLVYLFMK